MILLSLKLLIVVFILFGGAWLSWRVGSVECFGLRVLGFGGVHWRGASQGVGARVAPVHACGKAGEDVLLLACFKLSALFLYDCVCLAWCMSRCWCAGTMRRTDDKGHRNPRRHTPPISRRQITAGLEARDNAKRPRHTTTEFATTNNH